MKTALTVRAPIVVIAHNHPSGNLNPSLEDRKLTEQVAEASKLFDIRVLDHLIVTSESFYSLSDNGYI